MIQLWAKGRAFERAKEMMDVRDAEMDKSSLSYQEKGEGAAPLPPPIFQSLSSPAIRHLTLSLTPEVYMDR